jgi:hypothetical protein
LEIEPTDNAVKLSLDGLVDCGATSDFIDSEYVKASGIPVCRLLQPIPVFNVEGSPNEAGFIRDVATLVLRYKGHSERVQLAVTGLGKQKLILGYSWLWKHNPEINWDTWEVKMSRCPSGCTTCVDKARAEHKQAKTIARIVRQLRAGLVPTICAIDTDNRLGKDDDDKFGEDLPELLLDDLDDSDDKDNPLKDGDRVFYTQFSPPEDIRATSTISQRLSASGKATSGRPLSGRTGAFLNPW